MLTGRVAGSAAALAVGAVIVLGGGTAWADSGDDAGAHPQSTRPTATVPARGHTSSAAPAGRSGPGPKEQGAVRRTALSAAAQRRPVTAPRPSAAVRNPGAPTTAKPATPVPQRPAAAALPAAQPTGQTVNLPSYWPTLPAGEKRRFDYTAPDGSLPPMTAIFQYDPATKSMLYQEYDAAMHWQDTWYYRPARRYGIAEWRDDYPQNNAFLTALFGPVKKVVLSVPIGWGDNVAVGGTYRNRPVFALFRSSPPQIGRGRQTVKLEAVLDDFTTRDGTTYHDVAQFVYQQKWGFSPAAGARYWMAKGVGPVAIQWIAEDPTTHKPVESVRIDAVVSSTA